MVETGPGKKFFRIALTYIAAFAGAVAVLLALLLLAAKLPGGLFQEHMLASAEYLCEGEQFGRVIERVEGSKIDRYADSILLNIAYHYDAEKPLRSVMESAYYYTRDHNENENLLAAVQGGKPANQQYLRYWHGSAAIVRLLLIMGGLPWIYVWNGLLFAILTVVLLVLLYRKRAHVAAAGIIAAEIATSCWFVPFSLEYTWMFGLMTVLAIPVVMVGKRWTTEALGLYFLVAGVVTNYLDFLTTETITLTVPLLLYLWLQRELSPKERTGRVISAVGTWTAGYAGMWVLKWVLASIVMGENVMPYVTDHVAERLGGKIGVSRGEYLWGAIFRNIRCLLPLEYGVIGVLAGIVILFAACYFGFVYRKERTDRNLILLCGLLGGVPYLRYLVLHNHSYLHCFFTYRAQIATILAGVLILGEVIDIRLLHKGRRRHGK